MGDRHVACDVISCTAAADGEIVDHKVSETPSPRRSLTSRLTAPARSLVVSRKTTPFPCKYVAAPMVGASDLPFRMLVRRHGADTVYTQMLLASDIVRDPAYADAMLQTCEGDRPLVVQIAGDDVDTMLKAALYVQHVADAVDINLGCPQERAAEGHYGAYMTDKKDWALVSNIVSTLSKHLKVPLWCKIRLQETLEATIAFAKMLEDSGCSLLAVHGRKRGSTRYRRVGPADLEAIRCINEAVGVPVVANGNVCSPADVIANQALSQAAGIMSAEGLLRDPSLFARASSGELSSSSLSSRLHLAAEYIDFVCCLQCFGGIELGSGPALSHEDIRNHISWMLGKQGHGRGVRYDSGIRMLPLELRARLDACVTMEDFHRLISALQTPVEKPIAEVVAAIGQKSLLMVGQA